MQETREIRAMAIAATVQLRPGRGGWQVPSQSGTGSYVVDPELGECSCPDHPPPWSVAICTYTGE